MTDFTALPLDLPVPLDDGAAAHLPGQRMPGLELPATAGCHVRLDQLGAGRTVLYLFPRMGQPGQPLPTDWDLIPGARGCTPEACAFRDHHDDLATAGARVFGLSSQNTAYQAEAVDRLHLPFALLSDTALALAQALNLPTFDVDDQHLYKRLTLIVRGGVIEHVFYPVFPTDQHAQQVLMWLREHRPTGPAPV
jgi:peroxiredoxin